MVYYVLKDVDIPGFSNPCRCQLCQTMGGINLTVDVEDSMMMMMFLKCVYNYNAHNQMIMYSIHLRPLGKRVLSNIQRTLPFH